MLVGMLVGVLVGGVSLTPEKAFYQRLRENLPGAFLTRLESRVGLGIPDCLVALGPRPEGRFVMVELKVVTRGKKVALSPHQVAFHLKHASLNCPTFILVEYRPPGTRSVKKAELLLYGGNQAEAVLMHGVETTPLERWNMAAVPWAEVGRALSGGS